MVALWSPQLLHSESEKFSNLATLCSISDIRWLLVSPARMPHSPLCFVLYQGHLPTEPGSPCSLCFYNFLRVSLISEPDIPLLTILQCLLIIVVKGCTVVKSAWAAGGDWCMFHQCPLVVILLSHLGTSGFCFPLFPLGLCQKHRTPTSASWNSIVSSF